VVDGVSYPVTVQTLPTVVESYKTYDDVNLVKTADVGQVGGRRALGLRPGGGAALFGWGLRRACGPLRDAPAAALRQRPEGCGSRSRWQRASQGRGPA
jgi:hypothetical protein